MKHTRPLDVDAVALAAFVWVVGLALVGALTAVVLTLSNGGEI